MAHSHALKDKTGTIAGIAAISAGVGALTAMMVTPSTGQQVRGGIKKRASKAKDKIANKFSHSQEDADEAIDAIKAKSKTAAASAKKTVRKTSTTARTKKAAIAKKV